MEDTAWERLAEERGMSDLVSQVDWNNAPEDAQFYSGCSFRKVVGYCEYRWVGNTWRQSIFETMKEHEGYCDFEMRPYEVELIPEAVEAHESVKMRLSKTSIDFLEEVKAIQSQRASEYEQDGGERSFAKVATVFNTYTGKDLAPSDVALLLEILKNVRFYSQDGYHSDSVVDKISYASLWAELVTEERS